MRLLTSFESMLRERYPPLQEFISQYSTVKMKLEQMESMGIIRPSTNECASSIVIVPKKDGTI